MEPTLYILMRNDLESLNPGKAIAQGSHATNLFELEASVRGIDDIVKQWRGYQGFGRCLTVSANQRQIEELMAIIDGSQFPANTVIDPTYPITDGEVTHHIPLLTCAYVFVYDINDIGWSDSEVLRKLKRLPLYD